MGSVDQLSPQTKARPDRGVGGARRSRYSHDVTKRERYDEVLAKVAPKARERAPLMSGGPGEASVDADELYDAATLAAEGFDPDADLGFPGVAPFTRGVQPNMYRGRLWTMRQYAGFGTADESNARYRYLLSQGQTGLSVAFDLPTQMGFDSDHQKATGEVGRVGVAIDSIDDMRRLLAELPLDAISTSMTINATGAILLALYAAVGEERGVPRDALRGTIQNDILKEYIARGTYIFPPRPSLRLIRDVFAFAQDAMPRFNTISISGYHMREAGCTAVQEVAFTLADGIAYVQAAVDAGLDVDKFGRQLSFFFNGHNNFIEEIAKFRAARRLWARIMDRSLRRQNRRAPRRSAFTARPRASTLQAQQPMVNVVRVALQAMAAVLGGTQSLHTNGYDEALSLPTEEAATLALRTQQVIAHESGRRRLRRRPQAAATRWRRLTSRIEAERDLEYIEHIDTARRHGGRHRSRATYNAKSKTLPTSYQLEIENKQPPRRGAQNAVRKRSPSRYSPSCKIDPARSNAIRSQRVKRVAQPNATRRPCGCRGGAKSEDRCADRRRQPPPRSSSTPCGRRTQRSARSAMRSARFGATHDEVLDALEPRRRGFRS